MADRQAGSLWTPEEDVILLRHVSKYGTKHWGYLQTSGVLPHRDQKACCNRFILLKRKFFQARAKGQRLTFPVAPQPVNGTSSLSSPSSSRQPGSTSSRQLSPSGTPQSIAPASFKRPCGTPLPAPNLVSADVSIKRPSLTPPASREASGSIKRSSSNTAALTALTTDGPTAEAASSGGNSISIQSTRLRPNTEGPSSSGSHQTEHPSLLQRAVDPLPDVSQGPISRRLLHAPNIMAMRFSPATSLSPTWPKPSPPPRLGTPTSHMGVPATHLGSTPLCPTEFRPAQVDHHQRMPMLAGGPVLPEAGQGGGSQVAYASGAPAMCGPAPIGYAAGGMKVEAQNGSVDGGGMDVMPPLAGHLGNTEVKGGPHSASAVIASSGHDGMANSAPGSSHSGMGPGSTAGVLPTADMYPMQNGTPLELSQPQLQSRPLHSLSPMVFHDSSGIGQQQQPQQQQQQQLVPGSHSAMWRCFDPGFGDPASPDLTPLLPRVHPPMHGMQGVSGMQGPQGLQHSASHELANGAVHQGMEGMGHEVDPLEVPWGPEGEDALDYPNQGPMAPDVPLDTMAGASGRMLWAHGQGAVAGTGVGAGVGSGTGGGMGQAQSPCASAPPDALAAAFALDGGSLWHTTASAAGADLWDVMRTSASV